MAIRKFLLVLVLSFSGISASSAREIDLEKPSPKLKRFLSDVIYVVEVGDRERYSKRLPESIVVSFSGQAAQKAVAEKHLTAFSKVTGVKKIEQISAGETAAKIEFYFGPEAELTKTAKDIEKKISLDRGATYWTWWNGNNVIDRGVVFVATDKFSGAAFEDKLIEQLMGVYGLPAKSKEFDESCISAKDQVLTSLQPLDEAILGFYYRAIPAGTKPQEVDKIFAEKWSQKR